MNQEPQTFGQRNFFNKKLLKIPNARLPVNNTEKQQPSGKHVHIEMTVDHMTEKMQGGGKDPSFTSHAHPYKGRKVFTVHKALKTGETVVLIQLQGGQKYLVVDRVIGG